MANYGKKVTRAQKLQDEMYQRAIEREGRKKGGEGFQQQRNAMKSAKENYFDDYEREYGKDYRQQVAASFAQQGIEEKKENEMNKKGAKLNRFLGDLKNKEEQAEKDKRRNAMRKVALIQNRKPKTRFDEKQRIWNKIALKGNELLREKKW